MPSGQPEGIRLDGEVAHSGQLWDVEVAREADCWDTGGRKWLAFADQAGSCTGCFWRVVFVFQALPVTFIDGWRWSPVHGGGGSMDVRNVSSLASLLLALA